MPSPTPDFDPIPSFASPTSVTVTNRTPTGVDAVGIVVGPAGDVPPEIGLDRARLEAHGFRGKLGETLVLPSPAAPTLVAVGIGDVLDADALRSAAASYASAVSHVGRLAFEADAVADEHAAEAIAEGALLARYRYRALRTSTASEPLRSFTLVVPSGRTREVERGARRGRILAEATSLARDLANTPHSHLTASLFADLASELGPPRGLEVEVVDEHGLQALGVGGLLAVNRGSSEPPRMIKLTYRPPGEPAARLALVGKGVMYDSGGLGIKPNDKMHAQMKNDMSGAAAVLAAMLTLRDLDCPAAVTGFLMCTDNMPSGTALALGDVITIRGGTTVEVMDTDAEGRVVMSDALVMAREEGHDAIVDVATLTGASLRALGPDIAALFGNDENVIAQVENASARTGELVWRLPLHRPYRSQLDSLTADLANMGYGHGGAITAALFLAEFAGDTPWAHIDIAGPAQVDDGRSWLPAGCSGFGARLLAQLATAFAVPA